jgi:hypothetical protein
MNSHWVRLYSKITDSAIWSCPTSWRVVWIGILATASYRPAIDQNGDVPVGTCQNTLQGYAKLFRVSVQEVRSAFRFLETQSMIAVSATNQFTKVTVTNWEAYQQCGIPLQQTNNKRITNGQQTGSDLNLKEVEGIESIENYSSSIGIEGAFELAATEPSKPAKPKRSKTLLYTTEFEEWYRLYPRKAGKTDAATAYAKHSRDVGHAKLLDSLRAQLPLLQSQVRGSQDYRPYPASWLNAGHYWNEAKTQEQTWREKWKDL